MSDDDPVANGPHNEPLRWRTYGKEAITDRLPVDGLFPLLPVVEADDSDAPHEPSGDVLRLMQAVRTLVGPCEQEDA